MDNLTLIGAIVGSAAFGAVAGKMLDAFVITPWADRYQKKRWLRQTKIEAYTKLTEEILSLGMHTGVMDDPLKFRGLCAKAILLIDDKQLIAEIERIIEDIYKLSYDPSSIVKSDLPDNFSVTLPNGRVGTKKHFERGVAIEEIGKEALKLAEKLAKDLKAT